MIEREDLVDELARVAFGAMPPGKADEFAAYLGHPGLDRRWINRVCPAELPAVTIDRPARKPRARRIQFERPRSTGIPVDPPQLRLL